MKAQMLPRVYTIVSEVILPLFEPRSWQAETHLTLPN
jgi:hypothetical protein